MKTPSIAYLITTCLLAGALTGCAPTVTSYQLEPVSGEVARIDGRSVTKAEQNGLGVVASFEREDLEYVALDIEIKNHTDHAIEVNPADFHFAALGATQDTLVNPQRSNLTFTGSAANPDYEAGRMTFKRKQEEKRLKRAKIFNTVLMVAAIAAMYRVPATAVRSESMLITESSIILLTRALPLNARLTTVPSPIGCNVMITKNIAGGSWH